MGTRLAPVVLVGLLLLCTCGGGGGGDGGGPDPTPTGPEAVLDGTYFTYGYTLTYPLGAIVIGSPDRPCCTWGNAVSDGEGTLDWTVWRNVDHELDPDVGRGDLGYSVPAPGRLDLHIPSRPELPYMGGRVTTDGRFASLAKIIPDESPGVMILARRGGTYSDASLSGSYVLSGFTCSPGATALFGAVNVTAPGTAAGTAASNVAGTPGGSGPIAMTYSTSTNGSIDLGITGFADLVGGVVAAGDVVVAGGATADGQPPALFALVRSSTGRALADFDGEYGIVGYRYDVSAHGFVSATGTLTADGAGNFTTTLTVTDGTTLWEELPGGGTYDISTVGVLLLTNTLGETFTGALSPDGTLAIASGSLNVGQDPAFFFLHR